MCENVRVDENQVLEIYERKLKDFKINANENWAIYGSGKGAELVFEIFKKWGIEKVIVAVIDNDEVVKKQSSFQGFRVSSLEDNVNSLDGIIISSMDWHEVVYERVLNQLRNVNDCHIKVVNLFGHNTHQEIKEYVEYVEDVMGPNNKKDFVAYDNEGIAIDDEDTKIIAWYLPQFHRIDINDKFHGRGFTEWTNTSTTIPMFKGHYQPHVPYDVGYYSLDEPETMYRQVELAKHYGVYGFSFYYYWFSGKRIMEKPLNYFLNHPDINIKFCLTWANENWTSRWDGGSDDLIYEQLLRDEDDVQFIKDAIPYFSDERYIRIDGKAVLIVYRVNIWQKSRVIKMFETFRDEMSKQGLGQLFIILCDAFGFNEDAREWGADALVEFPPHAIHRKAPCARIDGYLNPKFLGHIRDTKELIDKKQYLVNHDGPFFRGVVPYWDNSARKAYSGADIYTGLNHMTFETWLKDVVRESKEIHSKEEDYVFVNAWNEWAEGAHLEPDIRFGYANLAAVKNALMMNRSIPVIHK